MVEGVGELPPGQHVDGDEVGEDTQHYQAHLATGASQDFFVGNYWKLLLLFVYLLLFIFCRNR